MNTVRHPKYFLLLFLALGLVFGSLLRAEDKMPPAPPPPEAPAPAVADDKDKEEPAATPADKGDDNKPVAEETKEPAQPEAKADDGRKKGHHHHSGNNNERVSFGYDSTLGEGEQADAVVSIFGSSTSAGEVGDAVVSVIGSSRVTGGTVGDAVVSVLGNTYVNGHVRGEVVAVLGNIELGPKAVVEGELVCVGGQIIRDPAAEVRGNVQNIAVAGRHFNFDGVSVWIKECLLYARPLAFNDHIAWAWCIALAFLTLYLLIALVAPRAVVKCAETLEQRPGSSLLAAVLTLLLTPVAFILLALTLFIAVGFVLIPALSMGLFFAALFGKAVMLVWLGRRVTNLFGEGPLAHPFFGALIGGIIVLGLYTIPIAGFIIYKLLGILGLGVVVYTLILQYKSSRPARPAVGAIVPPVAASAVPPVVPPATEAVPPLAIPVVHPTVPAVISAATLSRAGFWIRVGAAALDFIMVMIITGIASKLFRGIEFHPGGGFPLWLIIYHSVFWATKGTTIGGIICGLKVVRLDDRPLDWGVAIVRSLCAVLSLVVAGLGFIWVAFDDERQSWHDKIAGTTIVKVPKGTSLM